MYYTTDAHIDAYLAQQERAEALHEAAVAAFGEDYDQMGLDPEDRVLVDEGDVTLVTQQDRDDLQVVLDWEEYHI